MTSKVLHWMGIRVVESPFPLEHKVPVKRHRHRHNQSAAYRRRVQKKWNKRYGLKTVRYAIAMSPQAAGLMGAPSMLLDRRDIAKIEGL